VFLIRDSRGHGPDGAGGRASTTRPTTRSDEEVPAVRRARRALLDAHYEDLPSAASRAGEGVPGLEFTRDARPAEKDHHFSNRAPPANSSVNDTARRRWREELLAEAIREVSA
jgi:hypothetical protein